MEDISSHEVITVLSSILKTPKRDTLLPVECLGPVGFRTTEERRLLCERK
jgi:hypothetical protein